MNIYNNLTFTVSNLREAKEIKKKFWEEKKINILHSFKDLLWQGPDYSKGLSEKLKSKKIIFIVETFDNVGLTLSSINLGIDNIAISKTLDKRISEKIFSIAKKKKTKIYISESFNYFFEKKMG